jgi:hypothetical protein
MILFIKKNWRPLTFGFSIMIAGIIWAMFANTGQHSQKSTNRVENTKESLEIPPEPYVSESEIIQQAHHFYNQTAGWGRIDSLNWEKQKEFAQLLLVSLDVIEEKESLRKDFEHIHSLASFINEKDKDKQNIILLHRIFHDLDIDMNNYENDDYFEVTNYGEGKKQKEVLKQIESNSGA